MNCKKKIGIRLLPLSRGGKVAWQRVGDNLEAVHEARSWSAEVDVPVRDVHPTGSHGRQIEPAEASRELRQIFERAFRGEAAAGDEENDWAVGDDFLTRQRSR